MAGVSILLQKLTSRDDVQGIFQGYPHSIFTATGPWLLSIFWVGAVYLLTTPYLHLNDVVLFRQVLFYNFSFSLVFSAPLLVIVNRYLGDLILTRQVDKSADMFMGALAVVVIVQLPLVGIYYGKIAGLHGLFRIAAAINYFVLTTLWLLLVFLSALRAYRLTVWVFFVGMLISLYFTVFFARAGSISGMLTGFTGGLLLIIFTLLGYVLAGYRQSPTAPLAFIRYFKEYWDLALAGLGYFLTLWVDKWVMWMAPDRSFVIPNMPAHRAYETAMLLGLLTTLPALIMFLVHLETNFTEKYLRFYRTIRVHAHFGDIKHTHQIIIRTVKRGARTICMLQASISLAVFGAAEGLFTAINFDVSMVPMFRLGVAGSMFHVFTALALVILLLFDYRRLACYLCLAFAGLSTIGTYCFMKLGVSFYGYGYCLSAILCFVVAVFALVHGLRALPYHTFVVNNEST